MIKSMGDEIIDSKDYHVHWDREINIGKEAARITRFDPVKYKKLSLHAKEIFPTIKDWLETSDYIVGHNILGFDIYLIKDLYEYMEDDWRPLMNKIIDTNCIARGIKMSLRFDQDESFLAWQYKMVHTRKKGVRTSMGALGKELKIDHDYDKLHDALVDLELNLKIWNKMKWQIEI
jgi:DNA polymerase III epsilon subunit-like protein